MDRNNLETGTNSLRMPFDRCSWGICGKQLNVSDAVVLKSRVDALAGLSDEDILQLHHGALIDEYLTSVDRQLRTGEFRETTAHFLLAAISLNSLKPTDRDARFATAAQLLKRLREIAENDVIREPSQAGNGATTRADACLRIAQREKRRGSDRPDDVAQAVTDRWKLGSGY